MEHFIKKIYQVPIKNRPILTASYNQVFYYPVTRKMFGAVEINIKGVLEKIFHLFLGKSFVALDFCHKNEAPGLLLEFATCQAYEQYYTSKSRSGLPGCQGLQ